jgi:hypothetical protein
MAEPADTDDNEAVTKEKFDIGSGDNKQYQRLKVMVMLTLASNNEGAGVSMTWAADMGVSGWVDGHHPS